LAETWGKPVVVDNAPGAAGIVAASRVAKSAPDGYTLGFPGDAPMTTNVTLYDNLPYDPVRDFAHITIVAVTPNLLVMHPSLPIKDVKGLISLAKAQPGKLNYASAGSGTSQHLAGALLRSTAAIDIAHVPYKPSPQIIVDVLTGQVAMTFSNIVTASGYVRDGRLRALAITSAKRSAAVPDIPTVAEAALPGFEAVAWFGLIAPAGTPSGVIARVHQDAVRMLSQSEVRSRLSALGTEVLGNSPQEFTAQIKVEILRKGKIVKDSGARPN